MFDNFECDRCGACCCMVIEPDFADGQREPKLVQLLANDVEAWPDELKNDWRNEWRLGQCHPPMRNPETHSCVFVNFDDDSGAKCEIYATRPHQCVAVEAGDAKCQHARDIKNLPPLRDRDGNEPTREMMEFSAEMYDMDFTPLFDDFLGDDDT